MRVIPALWTHFRHEWLVCRRRVACWLWPDWLTLTDRVRSLEKQNQVLRAENGRMSAQLGEFLMSVPGSERDA